MLTIAFGIVLGFVFLAFLPFIIGMTWGLLNTVCWVLFVLPFDILKSIVKR